MKLNKYAFFVFCSVAAALLACLSVGCKTTEVIVPQAPVDYSTEDAAREEIKRIDEIAKTDLVKALWRCKILCERTQDFSEAVEKCVQVEQDLKSSFENAVEAKNYIEAYRIYNALELYKSDVLSSLSKSKDFLTKEIDSLAVVSKTKPSEKQKVSQMIRGTVTVLVDKGFKIEHGIGYQDMVLGSGFFISRDGYIITNHHVISDCVDSKYEGYTRLYIKLSEDTETKIPAKVVGWDSVLDLALLKAEVDAPYVFELGSSNDLEVGDKIYVIGSPLGLESTLTSGIISTADRRLTSIGTVFQIDAAVNSGNSGGPMIDEYGRVQAIVFAGVANYQGLNFAIPVEYLKNELKYLYAGGKRDHSWIGCWGKTKRLPGVGSKNEGVTVEYVMPGSPAAIAGLEPGDVIVGISGGSGLNSDEKKITSLDELHEYYMTNPLKSLVKIEYIKRSEDDMELAGLRCESVLYLDVRPENPGYEVYRHDLLNQAMIPIAGMELTNSSSQNKNVYTITKLIKSGIAESNGFSEGDIIQLVKVQAASDGSRLTMDMYGKKRANGYLESGFSMAISLDSPYYF